jgi:hypothetical protein
MAIETLFNESYEALLKRARIESATEEQTVSLVNMSVSEVRIGFYKTLGTERVDEIVAIPWTENPSTEDDILRVSAANIEALWLTYLLLPRLPNNFMSSAHLTSQQWNEDPLSRDSDGMQNYLDALKQQIDSGLADLVEDPDDYESKTVRASSVGPEEPYLLSNRVSAYGAYNV